MSGTRSARLETLVWIVLLAVLVVAPNAFDEPTYLSYDGASTLASPTRWSEYLVLLLHGAGLSGGYINLLFDLVLPIATIVFLRRIFALLQFSPFQSIVFSFVVVASPVLFGYANPYYARLYNQNYYSTGLSWLTLPQAYYPPFFRTPEPQVSLLIAAMATEVALRWRSLVPVLLVAPVLYPFFSVPFAFVALCLLCDRALHSVVQAPGWRACLAIVASFVAIACAKWAFFVFILRGVGFAEFLPQDRWPLISGTGVLALLIYAAIRSRLNPAHRRAALFLAVAPVAAVNTQVISGFFEVPGNFEQNFGVLAVGVLFALALSTIRGSKALVGAAAVSCALLGVYSSYVFVVNSSIWQRVPPSEPLLDGLRRAPESVLISERFLADLYTLIAPGVHYSALAPAQALRSARRAPGVLTTEERFQIYLCTKQMVSTSEWSDTIPASTFSALDRDYRYLRADFPLLHLNRRTTFRQHFDPAAAPGDCAPREFLVFPELLTGPPVPGLSLLEELTSAGRWDRDEAGALVVTPGQQWAYSAQVPLTPAALTIDEGVRMMTVRAQITVKTGCVSIGVVTHDERQFVHEVPVSAIGARETPDVLFEPDSRGQWLVVRNCSADGSSQALLTHVELMPVRGVTVRSLRAAVPAVQ
jgi:hypothetical protein